jgi:homoserine kinase
MPTFLSGGVSVTVPATSANLGPGYDALGLALDLRDHVAASVLGGDGEPEISVSGEGAGSVPLGADHLVHRAMVAAFDHMGCPTPRVRLDCVNVIPHGRGLGSSSAAIVGGVSAARALVAGGSLLMDDDAVFALAAELEGHPDNVAPAFFGGFTVAYSDGGRFHATTVSVDPRVGAVAFVPAEAVETKVARGLLPATVPHADAAANAGRAALLVAALGGKPELLLPATEDRLHQPYRASAMPPSARLMGALRERGLPAMISGAGPTVLVLAAGPEQARETEQALEELVGPGAGTGPVSWRVLRLRVDGQGAKLERHPQQIQG